MFDRLVRIQTTQLFVSLITETAAEPTLRRVNQSVALECALVYKSLGTAIDIALESVLFCICGSTFFVSRLRLDSHIPLLDFRPVHLGCALENGNRQPISAHVINRCLTTDHLFRWTRRYVTDRLRALTVKVEGVYFRRRLSIGSFDILLALGTVLQSYPQTVATT